MLAWLGFSLGLVAFTQYLSVAHGVHGWLCPVLGIVGLTLVAVLRANERAARGRLQQGLLFHAAGNVAAAEAALREALQLTAGRSAVARGNLGLVLLNRWAVPEALSHLERSGAWAGRAGAVELTRALLGQHVVAPKGALAAMVASCRKGDLMAVKQLAALKVSERPRAVPWMDALWGALAAWAEGTPCSTADAKALAGAASLEQVRAVWPELAAFVEGRSTGQ